MLNRTVFSHVAGVLAATLVVAVVPVAAQQASDPEHGTQVLRAERAVSSLVIDGRLDEPIWDTAEPATQFTQRNPIEGEPATERTEVRIAYDRTAIYVGAKLYDRSSVSTRLGRRDSFLPASDWFSIAFDSYHDHLTAYEFGINPSGVRRDQILSANGDDEDSWDPVWDAVAHIDADGWTAELRIPLSQLRYRAEDVQTWGVQIIREISRNNEESWYAFTPKRDRAGVPRYAHLVGLNDLHSADRLELLPYVVTRAQYEQVRVNPDVTFENPYSDGSDHAGSIGVDLKYRLASNLTLDATFNPDFGQVEADPATINLTAFETRFDERRPFFVEGAEIFRFGSGFGDTQLFYSRRIGAEPPGEVPDDEVYSDMPDHSTILGAAKLSGKLRGWSIGVLDAVTVREHADYITEAEERGRAEVAPPSNFFAARGRRELRGGQSVIGGILTTTHRQLTDEALADRLRSSAYAGGIDFTHEWADREWSLSGFVSGSIIHGRNDVMVSAQRSSARYYHRPDADYLAIDSAATSLRGWSGRIELEKEAGEHWRGDVSFSTISPGYETNDLGFQSRADEHSASFALEYVNEEPGRVFRNWSLETRPRMEWNWGGDRLASTIDFESSGEWLNYWVTDFEFSHDFAALDDRLTRGGPLARRPARTTWSASVESDSRLPLTVDFGVDREFGSAGSSTEIDLELGFKPAPNWNLSISPGWTRERSTAQFVTSIADPLAASTFGRRYVFADLEEQELGISLRSNITFTPELTLELFARPFIGSGRFNTPKELAAPRTYRFLPYHEIGTVVDDGDELIIDPDGSGPAPSFDLEDEDFTFHSLRGNAVLRWEWRPGSTLFLVWQQQREAEEALGDLRVGRDFSRIGRIKPYNVFMIKVSYWFTP